MSVKDIDKHNFTHHFGESMSPLLSNRDTLLIVPQKIIHRGDIVLFSNNNEELIAHRIVDIEDDRIYTKGDNNTTIDDEYLHYDDMVAIVIARWRNGKKLKIYRAKKGILQYHIYKIYFWLKKIMSATIGKLVLPSKLRSLLLIILPKPKEVYFAGEYGKTRTLYLGTVHIGTYSKHNKCWQIRFPYRLVYTR